MREISTQPFFFACVLRGLRCALCGAFWGWSPIPLFIFRGTRWLSLRFTGVFAFDFRLVVLFWVLGRLLCGFSLGLVC